MHTVEWAAGFFEGEGYVRAIQRRKCVELSIDVAQVYREPLDKLQELFGGKVYGPYGPYAANKQPYFKYAAHGELAVQALNAMLPYLFRKGDQARVALTVWENRHI